MVGQTFLVDSARRGARAGPVGERAAGVAALSRRPREAAGSMRAASQSEGGPVSDRGRHVRTKGAGRCGSPASSEGAPGGPSVAAVPARGCACVGGAVCRGRGCMCVGRAEPVSGERGCVCVVGDVRLGGWWGLGGSEGPAPPGCKPLEKNTGHYLT